MICHYRWEDVELADVVLASFHSVAYASRNFTSAGRRHFLKRGDSTSICQFRRIFGESQRPSEGFQLDPVGSRPAVYRSGGEMTEFEQELWSRFWQYANDPAAAREAGVRAAHGEAPSIKLLPGKTYKVLLRASDGLTIVTEDGSPSRST